MNILKSSQFIEMGNYQKIFYHLKFNNIYESLFSGINQYRFFNISFPNKDSIKFEPKKDYFCLSNLYNLSQLFNEDYQNLLLSINESKIFNIRHKKKILCYLHLDWILSLQYLKEVEPDNIKIQEYLQFETGNNSIIKKIKHINGTADNRSNIYTINQDSVVVNFIEPELSKNIDKLTNDNYKLILKNPLISFIEISNGFDNYKLNDCLKWINKISNKIIKNNHINESMKFNLKIRKIKRTNKKGMYIANQNTIMVDPRYIESFTHELGHWYHTHFQPHITEEYEAEEFANKFIELI